MKLHAKKENGVFKFTGTDAWVKMRIRELPDNAEFDVIIRKHFKQRSLSQNAYYWGVVVELVFEGLVNMGYDADDGVTSQDDAHEVLKSMFFKKIIHSEKSDNLEMIMSTTKYSTKEFSEKMEEITRWAFTFLGITIPPPNSQAALDFYNDKKE